MRFQISDSKLTQVVEIVRSGNPAASRENVVDFINADWPNADEHQEWLNEATPMEIASWVEAGGALPLPDEDEE